MWYSLRATLHTHGDMVQFRALNAIRTWLQTHWQARYTLLFVKLFALRVLSHCKHDMIKCGNTWKSAHPPLWQTCKRCSAYGHSFALYGHSFARLRHMESVWPVSLIFRLRFHRLDTGTIQNLAVIKNCRKCLISGTFVPRIYTVTIHKPCFVYKLV